MKGLSFISSVFMIFITACTMQEGSRPVPPRPAAQPDTAGFTFNTADSTFSQTLSSTGQILYVPVYSHIYQLNQQKTFNLTATLSFRNADLSKPLTLTRVLYYDSSGKLIKNYLEQPVQINPLSSTSFVVEETDLRGGVGANFIIGWEAKEAVYPPVVEAVMISTSQQQGISFISKGRVIKEKKQP